MPFTVTEFHDLVRLLEQHPEWRAELRRLVIPEALVDLPRALEALAEAQCRTEVALDRMAERMERGFAEAAADRQRIWETIRESNERMEEGFQEFRFAALRTGDAIKRLLERIEQMQLGVSEFAKFLAQQRFRDRALVTFVRYLRRGHDVTRALAEWLDMAYRKGCISDEEFSDILLADLLWRGQERETHEKVVLVAVFSWQVEPRDVDRVVRLAAAVRRTGLKALPVIAGRVWPYDVKDKAQRGKVVIVQEGLVDEASWEAALAEA